MDFFTIMDDLTLYGVDIAVISGVTCTIVQILKRTVLKNCNKKVLTFLPFVIGTVLYAVFAGIPEGFRDRIRRPLSIRGQRPSTL